MQLFIPPKELFSHATQKGRLLDHMLMQGDQ
uniref:Uncharacterized protein n=1 Tax=Rhizophora mucronata TaxID=61149 RepID=A0A2P2QP20_RHIMU